MTLDVMREFFGWCSVINIAALLWWFFAVTVLHDWVYRMHTKWFKISVERFDAIHYTGAMFFKIFVTIFNVIPYFVLKIMG